MDDLNEKQISDYVEFEIHEDRCPYSHDCLNCGREILKHTFAELSECIKIIEKKL